MVKKDQNIEHGGAGYRSRYLSHAKRALYHLSYAPVLKTMSCACMYLNNGPVSPQLSLQTISGVGIPMAVQLMVKLTCMSAGTSAGGLMIMMGPAEKVRYNSRERSPYSYCVLVFSSKLTAANFVTLVLTVHLSVAVK